MTFKQMIMMAIAHEGINQKELAERIGTTPQNLSSKLRSAKYSTEELETFCKAFDAELTIQFKMKDGTIIG